MLGYGSMLIGRTLYRGPIACADVHFKRHFIYAIGMIHKVADQQTSPEVQLFALNEQVSQHVVSHDKWFCRHDQSSPPLAGYLYVMP